MYFCMCTMVIQFLNSRSRCFQTRLLVFLTCSQFFHFFQTKWMKISILSPLCSQLLFLLPYFFLFHFISWMMVYRLWKVVWKPMDRFIHYIASLLFVALLTWNSNEWIRCALCNRSMKLYGKWKWIEITAKKNINRPQGGFATTQIQCNKKLSS